MDASRGIMSGTMDRFKMVISYIRLFSVSISIYIFLQSCWKLDDCVEVVAFLCRYLRKNLAEECVHLLHVSWFLSLSFIISSGIS